MTGTIQEEAWKLNHQASVTSGIEAVKAALYINGGAAVAILGFVGALAGQGRVQTGLGPIADSLFWFGLGVLSAAMANGLAYLANRSILESTSGAKVWRTAAFVTQTLAMSAVVASLLLFVFGLNSVRIAIGKLHLFDAVPKIERINFVRSHDGGLPILSDLTSGR